MYAHLRQQANLNCLLVLHNLRAFTFSSQWVLPQELAALTALLGTSSQQPCLWSPHSMQLRLSLLVGTLRVPLLSGISETRWRTRGAHWTSSLGSRTPNAAPMENRSSDDQLNVTATDVLCLTSSVRSVPVFTFPNTRRSDGQIRSFWLYYGH